MAAPSDREMMRFQRESLAQMLKINASLAGLQLGSSISRSMGSLPGARTVQDYFDVRKRMKFEETGRDPTGRKLTKRELEDREAQRRATYAMGTILEIFQDEWGFKRGGDGAVPVEFTDKGLEQFKDIFGGMTDIVEKMSEMSEKSNAMVAGIGRIKEALGVFDAPPPRTEAAVTAAREERADLESPEPASVVTEEREAEKEKEDDKDTLESEKRQQKFFEKLFGKKKDEKKSDGGIFSWIMGLFGGGGGLKGMLSRLIGPLLSSLGGAAASVVGFLGGLLPALIPIALAGAAGLAIRKFMDDATEERLRAGGERMAQGFKTKYAVKDKSGKTTLKTAEELGTTDQAMFEAQDDQGNIRLTEGEYAGQTVSGKGIPMLTQGGAMTDMIHGSADEEQKRMYRDIMGRAAMGAEASREFREGQGVLKSNKWLEDSLFDLNDEMSEYQKSFTHNIGNIQDEETGKRLVDQWNLVKRKARGILETAKAKGRDVEGAAARLLDAVTNQHGPFEDLYSMEEGFASGEARYIGGGLMGSARIRFPSVTKGRRKPKAWYEGSKGFESVTSEDSTRFSQVLGNPSMEQLEGSYSPYEKGSMTPIPTMGSNASMAMQENSALRNAPVPQPQQRQPSVSDNRVTNNTNMISAASARLGGANQTTAFNGIIAFA